MKLHLTKMEKITIQVAIDSKIKEDFKTRNVLKNTNCHKIIIRDLKELIVIAKKLRESLCQKK